MHCNITTTVLFVFLCRNFLNECTSKTVHNTVFFFSLFAIAKDFISLNNRPMLLKMICFSFKVASSFVTDSFLLCRKATKSIN